MKRILILDTECTGLDPERDTAIEVAAVLYSVEHATPIASFASLLRATSNAAEKINRIPSAVLAEAPEPEAVWARVGALADVAGAVVAHNADFDRRYVPAPLRDGKPWICSMSDIEWPRQSKAGGSLVSLALEHDLGVAHAHRALADCDLLARLFTRSRELGADLEALLARALRPKGEYVALVTYEERELAKAAGFRWDAGAKQWKRRMAVEDAAALPFRTRRIDA